MSNQKKQWGAIIVMIALFAMIAFVTNLCSPMANIIKAQGDIPEVLAQIGNYGNFVAYLIMGIPAGMLISKFGYKKTALIGLTVGIIGILVQWASGLIDAKESLGLVFGVYLIGAFIAGFCMCILVVAVTAVTSLSSLVVYSIHQQLLLFTSSWVHSLVRFQRTQQSLTQLLHL